MTTDIISVRVDMDQERRCTGIGNNQSPAASTDAQIVRMSRSPRELISG